jgi:hypothetical protein
VPAKALFIFCSFIKKTQSKPMANLLIHETSHYLLQHAHNPVQWYPWGDEAFKRAETENKPVLVSIGYAACHWCHVMERESFEDEEVAAYMNDHFICIKVDREERPDIDQVYMDAVQGLTGSGGWPLNVFLTPERIPFYGGTYYPPVPAYHRPSWMQLLQRLQTIWVEQHDQINMQAAQMLQYLKQTAAGVAAGATEGAQQDMQQIAANMLQSADREFGGFGNAPKFPAAMAIAFLLENYYYSGNKDHLDQALNSLDAMAAGGIYDQLGGGFARYSTDRQWLVPHFEKMLYDNALLVMAYADAYMLTGNSAYREVAEETIAFAERELKGPEGGYYCALDADSEGEEGKFYTWTWEEWTEVLGPDAEIGAAVWGVSPAGNFEGVNILWRPVLPQAVAAEYGIPWHGFREKMNDMRSRLMQARGLRIRPLTDDKRLLSWNALMNIALTKAARAFGNSEYLSRAATHLQWMEQTYLANGSYCRSWKNGTGRIAANLEDLAFLAQAMLEVAGNGGDTQWLSKASTLISNIIADFSCSDEVNFYYTPVGQTDIPVRKVDMYDGATPSANAVMARNLLMAGLMCENTAWIRRGRQMLDKVYGLCLRSGTSFGYWAQTLQRSAAGYKTLVVTGAGTATTIDELRMKYLPDFLLLKADKNQDNYGILKNKFSDQKMYIFVCSETECYPPFDTVEQALATAENIH